MPNDSDVIQTGTDSSGRPVLMTRYMQRVWQQILADPAVAPFAAKVTIVQGAWMARAGGGAAASAGYHDAGGCLDVRTWNLTGGELEAFIRAARRHGFAFWRRDSRHGGMDPHAHGVLGTDHGLASGAAYQWRQYLDGRDGLASNGPDYEWRPSPLVTTPPEPEEDPMADYEADLKRIEGKVDALTQALAKIPANIAAIEKSINTFRGNEWRRDVDQGKQVDRIEQQTKPKS